MDNNEKRISVREKRKKERLGNVIIYLGRAFSVPIICDRWINFCFR
jgi:hypothetical protein